MPRSQAERRAYSGDEGSGQSRRAHHFKDGSDEDHGRRRSRSPDRKRRRTADERRRSASPDTDARDSRHHRHHRRHHHRKERTGGGGTGNIAAEAELPFSARRLGKSDLQTFEPLFVHYLAVQKQKEAEDMDEREFRGRWKSFVGKWNRGELAEGWYDPDMFTRIAALGPVRGPASAEVEEPAAHAQRRIPTEEMDDYRDDSRGTRSAGDADEDGEDYGPTLPLADARRRAGAQVPSLQDLSLRNEMIEESRAADRESLRAARKADRALQKERLEDLAPRAEPGTRERRLEKRREVNDKMRQFRDKSPDGGGGAENEQEVMGGGDSLDEYKRAKEREQKRKSERQIRREEMERARREEMEARRRAWQEREDGTVSMLRELAKQRFG
ncbi:hypothetical protein JDV02_008500 [Purpureocillium takamizusanense]|uniref:Uncharacterized protein n=1 Tax=Purpureocillium takamizusanense TaxID=2060973 RepID=A0A9Q8QNZ2_9HYPO|nr:uncharacterized protein JDV02_008500 [Purpureocillium takamizusanense]UNI22631.1 hypothetical protein JDV02_008500 [Purpureocillium takamizusanense]